MYDRLTVERFRGIQDTELRDLARVNLISGPNNVGKTALLEAAFLHACGPNAAAIAPRVLSAIRGRLVLANPQFALSGPSPWASLFPHFDETRPIVIAGTRNDHRVSLVLSSRGSILQSPEPTKGELADIPSTTPTASVISSINPLNTIIGKQIEVQVRDSQRTQHYTTSVVLVRTPFGDQLNYDTFPIPQAPLVPGYFSAENIRTSSPEVAQRFSNLKDTGDEEVLFEALKALDPRLKSIEIRVEYNLPVLSLRLDNGETLPITLFGSGMIRLIDDLLSIHEARDGIVLIDEIENGIHHTALAGVWRAVSLMASTVDAQVFASTHSQECIDAAASVFSDSDHAFRLYRMRRAADSTSQIEVIPYLPSELTSAERMGLEIR